jgi:hypothetical protein
MILNPNPDWKSNLNTKHFRTKNIQTQLRLHVHVSMSESEWLVFNAKWAIFRYIIAKTNYISMRWQWCLLCTRQTCLVEFSALAHWNNTSQVDMSLNNSYTLFWFLAKLSFFLPLNAACIAANINFSLWFDLTGWNSRSTPLKADTVTIISLMHV